MSVKPYGVVILDCRYPREVIIPFPGDPGKTVCCTERLTDHYVDTWQEFQGPDGTDWDLHVHQEDTKNPPDFTLYLVYDWGTDTSIPHPLELVVV